MVEKKEMMLKESIWQLWMLCGEEESGEDVGDVEDGDWVDGAHLTHYILFLTLY